VIAQRSCGSLRLVGRLGEGARVLQLGDLLLLSLALTQLRQEPVVVFRASERLLLAERLLFAHVQHVEGTPVDRTVTVGEADELRAVAVVSGRGRRHPLDRGVELRGVADSAQ
jgi:hypothetical protein